MPYHFSRYCEDCDPREDEEPEMVPCPTCEDSPGLYWPEDAEEPSDEPCSTCDGRKVVRKDSL